MNRYVPWVLVSLVLILYGSNCAGLNRNVSGCVAQSAGANWIVVQYDFTGIPIMCWELRSTSIANEGQSDGIYWQDAGGNMIHISGLYNRVMVRNGKWDEAYRLIGLSSEKCRNAQLERGWMDEQIGAEIEEDTLYSD